MQDIHFIFVNVAWMIARSTYVSSAPNSVVEKRNVLDIHDWLVPLQCGKSLVHVKKLPASTA